MVAFVLAMASAATIISLLLRPDVADRVHNYLLFQSLSLGVIALVMSNYLIDKHTTGYSFPSWFARWAGIVATLDTSAFLAMTLVNITQKAKVTETAHVTAEHLSGVSYVILSIVFLMIIGGLGWCFYRAIMATSRDEPAQP